MNTPISEVAMARNARWTFAVLVTGAVSLAACHRAPAGTPGGAKPARVEHIDGTDVSRVTLTRRAAERLDIKDDVVRETRVNRSGAVRKVVSYAAVLYDARGDTWVYTSPEPLVFVRQRIKVDYIEGDRAVLWDGPTVGTRVVTVGGAELFGAEFEIGH
jgi:hypothetical protein